MGSATSDLGGFRILKLHPQGPAEEAGLEVLFDIIVKVGGGKLRWPVFFPTAESSSPLVAPGESEGETSKHLTEHR